MKDKIATSLLKTYRKKIYSKFLKALTRYNLLKKNDKIAVCISGGKDSFLLAKCFSELHKYTKIPFSVEYIVMNPGYKKEVIEKIKENALKLNIDIKIFDSDIFSVSTKLSPEKPCYMCARMRRGFLYKTAQNLGCNKIALGHHFDDVISTTIMSMFYNGEFKTMMPRLKSTNFEGLELIRPLYLVKEDDIKNFAKANSLEFINCACSFTERTDYESVSKRKEIRKFLEDYRKINPNIEQNIFNSLENINLNTIISYEKDGKVFSVLDEN